MPKERYISAEIRQEIINDPWLTYNIIMEY